MRIRSHLLLLALGSVLPVLAFAVFVTALMVDREQRTFATAAIERLRGTMAAIDADIRGHETTLLAQAGLGSLESGNLDAFRADMQRVLVTQPNWANITLARPDGEQLLNAASPDREPVHRQARDLATTERAARTRSLAVGGIMYGPVSKELGITIAVPVVRDGGAKYVLGAFIRTSDFLPIVSQQRLGEGWVTGLIDATGRFIARVPPPPSEFASEAFRAKVALTSEGWYRGATAEGLDSYSAHITSPLTGWSIGLGVPADEVLAGARRTAWLMGSGMVFMIALAALLAIWLAQRVSGPVDAIARRARAIALGEAPPDAQAETRIAELEGVVAALNDAAVSVRERQRLLEREKELLQDADRAKDAFIAMLSHELRNPLSALTSASDLLERASHDHELAIRSRGIIRRQTRHMTRLIEDLLDVSRLVAGKVQLNSEIFDLGEIVRTVLNTWNAAGRFERHKVRSDVAGAWVEADRSRVEQILSNLLDNALKFSPGDTAITVATRREGPDAVLEVSDEGSGLSPDMLDTAFDLFVQGEQGLARASGGMGVGLALARRLAELQGGNLSVRSELGRGAAFRLRLPAVVVAAGTREPGTVHALHGKRRILVVDDNEDARLTLVALLNIKGHEVQQAADGNEALRMARTAWPEIILLDIGLPGIDGYEVARRLRVHGHDGTALIAISGYGQMADKQRAAEAGFDEHLTKPVSPERLDEVIAVYGQRARSRAVGNG
jgi:signal transduction histidine kinase/ActR/RegA family two-component response regulator